MIFTVQEIEVRIIKYIRSVARRRRENEEEVKRIEKSCTADFREHQNARAQEAIKENARLKAEILNAKKTKQRHKFGKMKMQRSRKPDKKVKIVVQTIDPE